jgi:nucleotide-binding universal stress UspA family protein
MGMICSSLVVAHDGTPHGDLLLRALLRRGLTADQVHVVQVLHRADVRPDGSRRPSEEGERQLAVYRHIRTCLETSPWSRATVHVVLGDPADNIVAIARNVGADLVAMGTHGRSAWGRFTIGSVAEHVLRNAPCPVLIIPDALMEQEELREDGRQT